jgi:hypothetical protein
MDSSKSVLNKVGMMLLSGPEAVYPNTNDKHGYVCSDIYIKWHSADFGQWSSIRIYSDGDGDEIRGYLNPMIRFANWDRKKAMAEDQDPLSSVSVVLSTLPFESIEVTNSIIALQTEIDRPLLRERSFTTKRQCSDSPEFTGGHLSVEVSSGWQSISRSAWITESPGLHKVIENLKETLQRAMSIVAREDWLEYYDWSPSEIAGRRGWKWDGSINGRQPQK